MIIQKTVDVRLKDAPAGAAEFKRGQRAVFDVFQDRLAAFDAEVFLHLGEGQKQFGISFRFTHKWVELGIFG